MKLFSILLLFSILPTFVLAQSNYQNGYILKNNGDTVKGFVDHQEWTKCPLAVNFKVSKDDKKSQRFNPRNINGFHISGSDTYITYRGPVSMNTTDVQFMTLVLDTTKKTDTLFLRQVTTGKHLTLYYQADNFKKRLFIAEGDDRPIELKYYLAYGESGQVVNLNIYKGQLIIYVKKYAPENDVLLDKIERISYERDDLASIVDGINNTTKKAKKAPPVRLLAGIGISTVTNEIIINNGTGNTRVEGTISPQINLGLDMFNNPETQQFVFRAELSLFQNSPHFHLAQPLNTNIGSQTYSFTDYTYTQYTAAITPQLIFNIYNSQNLKIHLGAGTAFYFSTYSNNKLETKNTDGSVVSGNTIASPYKLEPLWFNIPLQLGVAINKTIEIDATYTGYTGFTKSESIDIASKSLNFGIKYFFGKH